MSSRWRLVVMLAVIGSLVALGTLLSLSSRPDGLVAIIDSPMRDTSMVTCGAADASGVKFVPCTDPAANVQIVPPPWDDRGRQMDCPSETTRRTIDLTHGLVCWTTLP
jgi:hypothetical protein